MKDSAAAMLHVLSNPKPGNSQLPCWQCSHRMELPGDAHIACKKPFARMTGDPHGIQNGWFMYPFNFDPGWGSSQCPNYQSNAAVSPSVSRSVSPEQA